MVLRVAGLMLALGIIGPALGGRAVAAGGSISGTVTAGGVPVAGVEVQLYRWQASVMEARPVTGADGRYSASVPDGAYHVSFVPPRSSPYARQVYPRQTSTASATDVVVAGAPVAGIDASLLPARHIRGTVREASTGAGLPDVLVVAYVAESGGSYVCCYAANDAATDAGGGYDVTLPDGRYRVSFTKVAGGASTTQWWPRLNIAGTAAGHRAASDVTIAGADVGGIDGYIGPSGTQRGCTPTAEPAATTVYLPNITKTLGGPSGWVTPFIVQNVGAAGAALEVSFYAFADGSLVACRRIENLQPGTSFADVPNNDVDLPGNSQFSVVVRSYGSRAVSVVNEHQGVGDRAEALSYVGLSEGATTLHLPYVSKGLRGWLTTFIVQNLGTATTDVTIALRSIDGTSAPLLTRTIAPGRSAAIDPRSEGAIVQNDELAATLTATQPIAAVVNAHNDAAGVPAPMGFSYNATPASSAASTFMPYLLKEDLGSAGPGAGKVYVQNMGASSATPTLTFRRLGGGAPVTIVAPAPLARGATWAFDPQIAKIVGGYQLCRNAPAGSCIDPGEHSLVVVGGSFAVVNAMITSATAMGLVGATATAVREYLPNVTRTLGGAAGWSTPIVVQSAGATTATVRWSRFADGALVYTQTLAALANGASQQIDPRSVPALSDDTQYAVVVEADGPVATVVRELHFGGGDGAMGYEGFGAP